MFASIVINFSNKESKQSAPSRAIQALHREQQWQSRGRRLHSSALENN